VITTGTAIGIRTHCPLTATRVELVATDWIGPLPDAVLWAPLYIGTVNAPATSKADQAKAAIVE
jgi:hypothetical protein